MSQFDAEKWNVKEATTVHEGVRLLLEEVIDEGFEVSEVDYKELLEHEQPDDGRVLYDVYVKLEDGTEIAGSGLNNPSQTHGKPWVVELKLEETDLELTR